MQPKIQVTKEEEKKFYDEHQKELEHPERVRLSEILVSTEKVEPGDQAGLTAAQQLWIRDQLARHQDVIARLFERGATSVAYVAASSIWLFAIPILAIFILRDGRDIAENLIEATKLQGGESRVERILRHIDRMLAKYIRAQLALAGLSFVFYGVSMLVLGFPDAIALGLLGGARRY